jgi:hypothetical protein
MMMYSLGRASAMTPLRVKLQTTYIYGTHDSTTMGSTVVVV